MKKNLSMLAVGAWLTLAACGGGTTSKEASESIFGEKVGNAVQRVYSAKLTKDAYLYSLIGDKGELSRSKLEKMTKEEEEAKAELREMKDELVGKTVETVILEGVPLKLIKPLTFLSMEEDLNGNLFAKLEGEMELTEDMGENHSSSASGSGGIQAHFATESDSIFQFFGGLHTNLDPYKEHSKGTRMKLKGSISLNGPSSRTDPPLFQGLLIRKAIVSWDNPPYKSNETIGVRGELGLFELRGPVKSCTQKSDYGEVTNTFDQKGFWQTHNGQPLRQVYPVGIRRDGQGRIVKGTMDTDGNGVEYAYNTDGLLRKFNYTEYDTLEEDTYFYDQEGHLVKKHCEPGGMDAEEMEPYDETYQVLATDAQGNWTKRKVKSLYSTYTETRTIVYY